MTRMKTTDDISPDRPTVLSRRLQDIADCVIRSERVIDIGTDHGHLPAYLLENGNVHFAIATDIHRGPAETAEKYMRRQGVLRRARVVLTDGLSGIRLLPGDTVVISGLGGLEMIRILAAMIDEHGEHFPDDTKIILQPQRSAEELRTFLSSTGFVIEEEKISMDRDKIYVILCVRFCIQKKIPLTLDECVLGPYILKNHPTNTEIYLKQQRNVIRKRVKGRDELRPVLQTIENHLARE